MMRRCLIVLALLFVTPPVHGAGIAAADVLVPVAGRVEGGNQSFWQTELVVTNAHRFQPVVAVVTLTLSDGAVYIREIELNPRQTFRVKDLLLETFELDSGFGQVRVHSDDPAAELIARARIYNTGSDAGEFGQGVPGIPVDALTGDHMLTGLTNAPGNRTNVGISNPWEDDILMTVELLDAAGELRGSYNISIPPRTVTQITDVFAQFNDEIFENASIRLRSAAGFYGYASVVRTDSGDATFVMGSGVGLATDHP